jgi:hypothetical protein
MEDLKHWLPYKFATAENELQCHWFDTYGLPFAEPFFTDTISKCRTQQSRNFKFLSVSDLGMVHEWAADLNDATPAALIFHISRCGSTLISQMLNESDENIVLSEVPFFDDILRLPFTQPRFEKADINELLLSAIKHYAQDRNGVSGNKKRLFIKTDSWHLFFYEQLRQLFPSVPFILIYRSPDEVFRSHRKHAGMHSVAGLIEPEIFGLKNEDILNISPDIYLATVLENYLSRCFEIATNDDRSLLVNYNEGPMFILQKIATFINMPVSEAHLQKMQNRSLYHSKKPDERFHEAEIKKIPPYVINAMALYYELEEKRKVQ